MSKISELKEICPNTIRELTRRGWELAFNPRTEVLFIAKSHLPRKFATIEELQEMEAGIVSKIDNVPLKEVELELKNELL